jgi:plasmid stability protein
MGCTMITFSLKLPEALVARLEAEARSRQKSKSAIIREYLEQGLNGARRGKRPSFYELAQDLCGAGHSGVPDLATNPKHMEGFGK